MREKKTNTQFWGRTCVCTHLFRRSLHSCCGRSLCVAWICVVLCSFADGVEPFCLTLRSWHFERFVSVVLSHCPCLRGPRFALSSDLVLAFLWLLITCLSSLFISLLFLSFMNWWLCLLSMHSSRGDWGPERPRTGGWSLLGVMSYWQRGVDWLLAEYCTCRLRLDLCWCRWRAGAKGLSLCNLRGVERQVGSARWTRWPYTIKCGPHGGKKRKTKSGTVSWLCLKTKVEPVQGSGSKPESARGVWLVYSTKPTSSRDDMAAKSWVGLAWRLHRVRGVYGGSPQNHRGYLVEPQNQDQRLGGRRRDPGAPRNFEAGGTLHDRGACVGRMRRPDGCTAVRWRTSCVDQNSLVRAWVVTPSVGVLRSFREGLYIGGGGWIFSQLLG
jgi:hypothetical protein